MKYILIVTGLLCASLIYADTAMEVANMALANEPVYPASEVRKMICDQVDANIDRVIFLTRHGALDPKFDAIKGADRDRLIAKLEIFLTMFKDAVNSLQDRDYTSDFVAKAKLDVVEMMRVNKELLLLDEKELEKTEIAFVAKARELINQPEISAEKKVSVEKAFKASHSETIGYAQGLLNARSIYCLEGLMSRSVINLAAELGDGGDLELQLKRKYMRLYLGDLLEQIRQKLLRDYNLVTGNMFYGNSGFGKMLRGVQASRAEINEYVEQALRGQKGRIVFRDARGDLYGVMYDAVQFAYSLPAERKALVKQRLERNAAQPPVMETDCLVIPGQMAR